MSEEGVGCLLFIATNKPCDIRESNRGQVQPSIKGYSVLPQAFKDANPQILDSFLSNGIQVLGNNPEDATFQFDHENLKFEMFETLILLDESENEPANFVTLRPHSIAVHPLNKEAIEFLLNGDFEVLTLDEEDDADYAEVVEDNLKALECFFTADAEIAYNHHKGGTILHFAVKRSIDCLVKSLLECGANIKAERNDGMTPLHLAAKHGDLGITRILVENGADVDSGVRNASFKGWTPLVFSFFSKDNDTLRFLLESGANVDTEFDYHSCFVSYDYLDHVTRTTLLYIAVLEYSEEKYHLIDTILHHHPNIHNEFNKKAFHYILFSLDDEFIDVFNKMKHAGFKINHEDIEGFSKKPSLPKCEIHTAVINVLEETWIYGCDLRSARFLCGAIHKNYFQLVKSIIEKGTSVSEGYDHGCWKKCTPLHMAAGYANEEIINYLYLQGADVNAKLAALGVGKPETPLLWAVRNCNKSAIQFLIEHGANFSDDVAELTQVAAQNGLLDIVEFFLLNGITSNSQDGYFSAICGAASGGHLNVMKTLFEYTAELGPERYSCNALLSAYFSGHIEVFQKLLDNNFNNTAIILEFTKLSYLLPIEGADKYLKKSNCLTVLARHMIKMEVANMLFFDMDLRTFWFAEESLSDFQSHCKLEIVSLKKEAVNDSGLTLYDILIGDLDQLVGYAKNEVTMKNMRHAHYKTAFPIYATVLDHQIKKGYQRVNLMKQGIKIFEKLLPALDELPYELREKIISFMDNRDLICLAIAWSRKRGFQNIEGSPI